jgi:hypothetical protein
LRSKTSSPKLKEVMSRIQDKEPGLEVAMEHYEAFALTNDEIKEVEELYWDCLTNSPSPVKALTLGSLLHRQYNACHRHVGEFRSWTENNLTFGVDSAYLFVRLGDSWLMVQDITEKEANKRIEEISNKKLTGKSGEPKPLIHGEE